MENVSILIHLGNRQYKVKVAPEHESAVRALVQDISRKSQALRDQFPGRDEQDYLAMTLLDFITSKQTPASSDSSNLLAEVKNRISNIQQLLEP
ncbi:MAG: cell division protein ZapA [Bacteroidota bacterium]|nr:cell division protein ZapA [Chitinophagaceae bacterium]QLH46755.1 MAG: cell division protein ZapA [Bacteroidota bacterium]